MRTAFWAISAVMLLLGVALLVWWMKHNPSPSGRNPRTRRLLDLARDLQPFADKLKAWTQDHGRIPDAIEFQELRQAAKLAEHHRFYYFGDAGRRIDVLACTTPFGWEPGTVVTIDFAFFVHIEGIKKTPSTCGTLLQRHRHSDMVFQLLLTP